MNCVICKQGQTQPGQVFVTLQRDESIVVIKNVPADVCENCQEHYLSGKVTEQVLSQAEEAIQRGAEIEVVGFAA